MPSCCRVPLSLQPDGSQLDAWLAELQTNSSALIAWAATNSSTSAIPLRVAGQQLPQLVTISAGTQAAVAASWECFASAVELGAFAVLLALSLHAGACACRGGAGQGREGAGVQWCVLVGGAGCL